MSQSEESTIKSTNTMLICCVQIFSNSYGLYVQNARHERFACIKKFQMMTKNFLEPNAWKKADLDKHSLWEFDGKSRAAVEIICDIFFGMLNLLVILTTPNSTLKICNTIVTDKFYHCALKSFARQHLSVLELWITHLDLGELDKLRKVSH